MAKHEIGINNDTTNLVEQRERWRRKSWTIPELKGEKQNWFILIKNLINVIEAKKIISLDENPDIPKMKNLQLWRSYISFFKNIGLVYNRSGILYLTELGAEFLNNPTKTHLANLIHNKIRLFGEMVEFLHSTPSTIKETHEYFNEAYDLKWSNLSSIRKRMAWLEILDLIENIGNHKWTSTISGKNVLKHWQLISPEALKNSEYNYSNNEILEPPTEIAALLQRLFKFPEKHAERNTYNIWVPSPNRIENLRMIIQATSDRITREELFQFIRKEFNLKISSVKSMLPFLKASGLLEEVGRNIYVATAAALAWLKTGNDLDFI